MPNPICEPNTVEISGCSGKIPKLLYAKITDDSGCSEFDGKVMQLLWDDTVSEWKSDDDDLVVNFKLTSSDRTLVAYCVGGLMNAETTTEDCATPVDFNHPSWFLSCCGTADIHIGEIP